MVFLFLLLVFLKFIKGFYLSDFFVPQKKLAEKTLNYINENFFGKTKAPLIHIVKETDGLYRLQFEIEDGEAEVFVFKDGKSFLLRKCQ